jgi:7 transmembrane receptor (Secretin family)
MFLLQYALFGNGKSLTSDGGIVKRANSTYSAYFERSGSHWECKLLVVTWNYALVTSNFHMLVEGLYLHNIIYVSVFQETKVWPYVSFGWGKSRTGAEEGKNFLRLLTNHGRASITAPIQVLHSWSSSRGL